MSRCCPGCGILLGNEVGESSIYGSRDVTDLCSTCWLNEDDLIEEVGTNDPDSNDQIKNLLARYRANMRNA